MSFFRLEEIAARIEIKNILRVKLNSNFQLFRDLSEIKSKEEWDNRLYAEVDWVRIYGTLVTPSKKK